METRFFLVVKLAEPGNHHEIYQRQFNFFPPFYPEGTTININDEIYTVKNTSVVIQESDKFIEYSHYVLVE